METEREVSIQQASDVGQDADGGPEARVDDLELCEHTDGYWPSSTNSSQ